MSRLYCKQCAYPINTCVCAALEPLKLPIRVVILQHVKESKHAKNTARLAKLVSPSIEIVKLSDTALISILNDSLVNSEVIVLYPTRTSIALEDYVLERARELNKNKDERQGATLILIDASWRQAYGVWRHHEWLHQFTNCHFAKPPNRQYVIRKSKWTHQLSTIEALAHSIELICGISGNNYLNVFNHMQAHWSKHQTS